MSAEAEIGRPLAARELVERTVVCVRREDRPNTAATMWAESVDTMSVVFVAALEKTTVHFMVFRLDDETLIDDSGKRILVNEYLGKV